MANNQQLLLGEGAGSAPAVFVEDVFSTYLYTGTGSTQTITNNIDLSTKGGLVWVKPRSAVGSNVVRDSARGLTNALVTEETYAQGSGYVTTFTSTGYTDGTMITNGVTFASWTFREQPKFFDIVTYTGTGSATTIAHNLGSVPGCIIVKRTDAAGNWEVFHRAIQSTPASSADYAIQLNLADAAAISSVWNSGTPPTSLVFSVSGGSTVNASGGTYVAYLFAHDAGGFGLAGTDNVISCGSYTGTGAIGNTITLGYEPQWIMIKEASGTSALYQDWYIYDNMRGMPVGTAIDDQRLMANLSSAEASYPEIGPTATGFVCEATGARLNESGGTYIYIAIRRGPMKVPTVGTSVFIPVTRAGTGAATTVTGAAFPPDFLFNIDRFGTGPAARYNYDRLRGAGQTDLRTNSTAAEGSAGAIGVSSFDMGGFSIASTGVSFLNDGAASYINYLFRRAPGFFDEVCYTGTGSNTTFTHNLGVVPEVIIIKSRSGARNWNYLTTFGASTYTAAILNDTYAPGASPSAYDTLMQAQPTSTQFSVSTAAASNNSGETYVAYLFATCAGVSKVGTYTGNGSSQTIACGFAAGSRFVLIKRISASGDWYVWDSARGIVAGNDPHLSLNDTAAEVTTDDSVDTDNSGFIVNQLAATNVNVTSATYIFLAIA